MGTTARMMMRDAGAAWSVRVAAAAVVGLVVAGVAGGASALEGSADAAAAPVEAVEVPVDSVEVPAEAPAGQDEAPDTPALAEDTSPAESPAPATVPQAPAPLAASAPVITPFAAGVNAQITPRIQGSGAHLVPSSTLYRVNAQWLVNSNYDLRGGQTGTMQNLNAGSPMVYTAQPAPAVPGVTWDAPRIVLDGVDTGSDRVDLTVVDGHAFTVDVIYTARAYGDASISAAVVGDGADLVPAGTAYDVRYDYVETATGEARTGVLAVAPGQPVTLDGIEGDTLVTFTPVAPPAVDHVQWDAPTMTVDGVATTQATYVAGQALDIVLTHTATALPAEPAPTEPTDPAGPATPAGPTGPQDPAGQIDAPVTEGTTDTAAATGATTTTTGSPTTGTTTARPARGALAQTGASTALALTTAIGTAAAGIGLLAARRRATTR